MNKITYLIMLILFISCDYGKKTDKQLVDVEIKKDEACPTAQKIMTEDFYYDVTDEFSPFGNDVGNDTFYLYREWRGNNSYEDVIYFLNKTMTELNLSNFNLNTSATDRRKLISYVNKMPNQYLDLNWIDNAVISLAFTQLFLEGKVDKDVRELARLAIERELVFSDFWGKEANIREKRFQKMLTDLNKVEL